MKMAITKNILVITGVILMFFNEGEVNAYPISVDIQARITDIEDYHGYLTGAIGVGDIITGTYTYETETPDSNLLSDVGDYRHTTSPYGVTLSINGYSFRTDPGNVDFLLEMCNNRPLTGWDAYGFNSYNNLFDIAVPPHPVAPELPSINTISFNLHDGTGTALSGTEIPLVSPVLSDWQSYSHLSLSSYSAIFAGEYFYDIQADVYYVAPSPSLPVPEPATILILSSGIAGLLGFRVMSRKSGRRKTELSE